MPPTWAVLAYFHLYHQLPTLPLAIVGALGSTTGRGLLALGSRAFGARFLPESWRVNIETLVEMLQSQPTLAFSSLALFTLGPFPSNQLFIAAGIAKAPLPPILLVFGVLAEASNHLARQARTKERRAEAAHDAIRAATELRESFQHRKAA